MIRNVHDLVSLTSTQNLSTAESDSKNQFYHRNDFSHPTSPPSSTKEAAIPSVSGIFEDDEESWTFTDEELNMIMEVDVIDTEINELQQQKTWEAVKISANSLS